MGKASTLKARLAQAYSRPEESEDAAGAMESRAQAAAPLFSGRVREAREGAPTVKVYGAQEVLSHDQEAVADGAIQGRT